MAMTGLNLIILLFIISLLSLLLFRYQAIKRPSFKLMGAYLLLLVGLAIISVFTVKPEAVSNQLEEVDFLAEEEEIELDLAYFEAKEDLIVYETQIDANQVDLKHEIRGVDEGEVFLTYKDEADDTIDVIYYDRLVYLLDDQAKKRYRLKKIHERQNKVKMDVKDSTLIWSAKGEVKDQLMVYSPLISSAQFSDNQANLNEFDIAIDIPVILLKLPKGMPVDLEEWTIH